MLDYSLLLTDFKDAKLMSVDIFQHYLLWLPRHFLT